MNTGFISALGAQPGRVRYSRRDKPSVQTLAAGTIMATGRDMSSYSGRPFIATMGVASPNGILAGLISDGGGTSWVEKGYRILSFAVDNDNTNNQAGICLGTVHFFDSDARGIGTDRISLTLDSGSTTQLRLVDSSTMSARDLRLRSLTAGGTLAVTGAATITGGITNPSVENSSLNSMALLASIF